MVDLCAWLGIMLFQGGSVEEFGCLCVFLIFCFCWIASVLMMLSAVTAIEAVILVMDGYSMFLHKDGSVF